MWQIWLNGILGLWLVIVVFLGFSSTLNRVFFIVTGLLIAILSFWSISLLKPFPPANDSEIKPSNANSEKEREGEKPMP